MDERVVSIVLTFLLTVTKYLTRSNLRKKNSSFWFIKRHSPSWWARHHSRSRKVAGWSHSQIATLKVKKQRVTRKWNQIIKPQACLQWSISSIKTSSLRCSTNFSNNTPAGSRCSDTRPTIWEMFHIQNTHLWENREPPESSFPIS